jgi:acyl dehydratase
MPSGGILAKQEFEFKGLAKIGETLMVNATVIESYIDQKGRKRVTFLIEAKNQESKPVSTIRIYAIWPK